LGRAGQHVRNEKTRPKEGRVSILAICKNKVIQGHRWKTAGTREVSDKERLKTYIPTSIPSYKISFSLCKYSICPSKSLTLTSK
jgi:hypothetical protein